jgi:hypothetical protein
MNGRGDGRDYVGASRLTMSKKPLGTAEKHSIQNVFAAYFSSAVVASPQAPVTAVRPGGMGAALPPGRLTPGFGPTSAPKDSHDLAARFGSGARG